MGTFSSESTEALGLFCFFFLYKMRLLDILRFRVQGKLSSVNNEHVRKGLEQMANEWTSIVLKPLFLSLVTFLGHGGPFRALVLSHAEFGTLNDD